MRTCNKLTWVALIAVAFVAFAVPAARADIVSNASTILNVNPDGSINEVTCINPPPPTPFWNLGYPTIGYGIDSSEAGFGRNDSNVGLSDMPTVAFTAVANTISGSGTWGSLAFERTYTLTPGLVNVRTRLTNTGSSMINGTWFDSGDPDQGSTKGFGSGTYNDIYVDMGVNVASATSGAGDSVKWYDVTNTGVLSFEPGSLEIFDSAYLAGLLGAPYDPNGAFEDIGMAIMWRFALDAGLSLDMEYYQEYTNAVPEPGSLTLFGFGALGLLWHLRRRRGSAAA